MYHVSAQGVGERMINVHYYYCHYQWVIRPEVTLYGQRDVKIQELTITRLKIIVFDTLTGIKPNKTIFKKAK